MSKTDFPYEAVRRYREAQAEHSAVLATIREATEKSRETLKALDGAAKSYRSAMASFESAMLAEREGGE